MTEAAALAMDAKTATPINAVLRVEDLRAYYRTRRFGVNREVRAVDGVTFEIPPMDLPARRANGLRQVHLDEGRRRYVATTARGRPRHGSNSASSPAARASIGDEH